MYVTDAIEAFIAYEVSLAMAETTLANHKSHLRKLARAAREWERENGKRQPMKVAEIDARLITLYFARCVGGVGNRNNMTNVIRHFLRFGEQSGWLKRGTTGDLMQRRKQPFAERLPKHYIDPKDFPKLLASQDRHQADRATMAVLLYTLCRASEAADLRIKHVDLASRTLKVWREKTDRWTEVGICPELHQELTIWLMQYEAQAGPLNPDWYLLPRLTPVKPRGVTGTWVGKAHYQVEGDKQPRHMERIVKRGLDALGVTTTAQGTRVNHLGEGAHTIRRSGARAMLKHLSPQMGYGDALVTVSAMLDHKDVKVTLRYIGMERQKEELNTWLRGNSMYGGSPRPNVGAPLRNGEHESLVTK